MCRDKDGVMEELKKKTEEIQIARGELEKVSMPTQQKNDFFLKIVHDDV